MTIGERVKFRRQQLGLTQEELAKRLGNSSRASICTVEKDREDLTTTRIAKLAKALETSPSWLMGWTDNIDPNFPYSDEAVNTATENLDRIVGKPYYLNDETAQVAQSLFEDENLKMLFDAARGSKAEDLQMAADLLKRLKSTNSEG